VNVAFAKATDETASIFFYLVHSHHSRSGPVAPTILSIHFRPTAQLLLQFHRQEALILVRARWVTVFDVTVQERKRACSTSPLALPYAR
jgi:hypothetical protein